MDNREYLASADAVAPTRPVAPSAGFPRGGLTPTKPGPYWFHQFGEEMRAVQTAGGVPPDGNALTQIVQAIRRLSSANVTVVTAAMSPFALTADHVGLVLVNAAAGNVVLNLPLANVVAGLPLSYDFERIDVTANTVTTNAAGANLIDGVASFTLVGQWASRSIRGDALSAWATTASSVLVASTAEAQAQTDNIKVVTPLRLAQAFQGANQSLVANGWQRMPGGLILQWGTVAITTVAGTGGNALVTFPIAFPNTNFVGFATQNRGVVVSSANVAYFSKVSLSQCLITLDDVSSTPDGTQSVFWFALGN